ncbi:probable RNA-binding protein 18 [Pomacea canaliculata]|nr:probable RNA-binding protein 18 [Pomacea canaliculata]
MSGVSTTQLSSDESEATNDRRLWIGNLDLRISEFVLLKLVQKYGELERFDFVYHIHGPDKGKPRGYCFVTYATRQIAEKAMKSLNGKLALSRRLAVHWAKNEVPLEPKAPLTTLSALSEPRPEPTQESTVNTIRAIEAKLRAMQQTQKDFTLNTVPTAPPGSSRYSSVNAVKKPVSSGRGRHRPYQPSNHHPRRR